MSPRTFLCLSFYAHYHYIMILKGNPKWVQISPFPSLPIYVVTHRRKYLDRFFAECGLLLSADCFDWLVKEIKTSLNEARAEAVVEDGKEEEPEESVARITFDELMAFLLKGKLTSRLCQPGTMGLSAALKRKMGGGGEGGGRGEGRGGGGGEGKGEGGGGRRGGGGG